MFGSKYRQPRQQADTDGTEQPLGKAYSIMAVMMYGPDLPTKISLHNERQLIFMAAAPYAMSSSDIETVSEHPDDDERRIYYHNLLTTSCWPVSALLYNQARNFFQTLVFTSPRHNPECKRHLGLKVEESVFDTYVYFNFILFQLIPIQMSPFPSWQVQKPSQDLLPATTRARWLAGREWCRQTPFSSGN
jgi:hypothetical protein